MNIAVGFVGKYWEMEYLREILGTRTPAGSIFKLGYGRQILLIGNQTVFFQPKRTSCGGGNINS